MSKGLEALKDLEKLWLIVKGDSPILQQKMETIEKELKALEIIKELALFVVYQYNGDLYELDTIVDSVSLTKEQYDLLKEVGL